MKTKSLKSKLLHAFATASAEARLLEDGIIHMKDADDLTRESFSRNTATCLTETGLAIAEDIAAEVTFAVAIFECSERIAHTPHNKLNLKVLSTEFIESITSSTCAAARAALNIVHDIEKAGTQWEITHPKI